MKTSDFESLNLQHNYYSYNGCRSSQLLAPERACSMDKPSIIATFLLLDSFVIYVITAKNHNSERFCNSP